MAGRRYRGQALAGAVDLVTDLMLQRQKDERDRMQRAVELEQKFRVEATLEMLKRGGLDYDPKAGTFSKRAPFAPSPDLEPYQQTDPTTGMIYRNPSMMSGGVTGGLEIPSESAPGSGGGGLVGAIRGLFGGGKPASPATVVPERSALSGGEDETASELPNPDDYVEGDLIGNPSTGEKYRLIGGGWQQQ